MNNLGNFNLFTSHFTMGEHHSKNEKIDCLETLHNWLDFKNSIGNKEAQFVSFLHEIEIPVFEEILKHYVRIYKKSYPYGEKKDFIKQVFGYTIYDLQLIVSRNYVAMQTPLNIDNYAFYRFYEIESREYLEFAVPIDKTIEHFIQYYRHVIRLINDIQFEDEIIGSGLSQDSLKKPTNHENAENQIPQLIDNDLSQADEKECLSNLITHKNSDHIVKNIKVKFKGIKGKRLKLLLLALQESELLQKHRIAAEFHRCCTNEFNWKIASYNAMNDYKYNDREDVAELEEMKIILENLK